MDLYRDILLQALTHKGKLKITFEGISIENPDRVVEDICYKTLQRIRDILDNDALDDFECVERIVKLLEGIGSDGGSRHDFG